MITRALSSATTSLAITMGLLFGMHLLIATGENIIVEPRPRHVLDWIRVPDTEDPIVETRELQRFDKPKLPPPVSFPDSGEQGSVGVGLPATPPTPRLQKPTMTGNGLGDGPLVSILKVQPQYPAAAQSRGLEGTVIVRYDVTPLGTIDNVAVIESSNRIFEKAAIEATYRFRYRPKVIDGTAYGVTGLRHLFRFEMDE